LNGYPSMAQTATSDALSRTTKTGSNGISSGPVIERLDAVVDDFVRRTRYFNEPLTRGRAMMFALQHRLNTRQRNSVLKLRVATNCPDWDLRLRIIGACTEEVIADHEHGGGRPHWGILEDLGTRIGLKRGELQGARPLVSTRLAWLSWEALMSNRHWLEGLVANTCAERANIPGYGSGIVREHGWFGLERHRWGELFKFGDAELEFFELHEAADIAHSNLGWNAVAEHAHRLGMEDAVVEACRVNLLVWETYLNGIGAGGDLLDRGEQPVYA
jgi:pyrroloquinoline quinone (PQQ) biosynthesis protein C